jgi:nucleotide-binding universal stress UspA family protein
VVVGVDGTYRSIGALRWAADEARRRGVGLLAVHACDPAPRVASYAPVHPQAPAPEVVLGSEREHLADLIRTAFGADPGVAVRQVCEPTSPIRALLAHGRGACLLVLATSTDLVSGIGIGSTALALVRHPPCPVVVLPEGSWER